MLIHIFEINSHGMFSWFIMSDITYSMRCQVNLAILIFRDLELAFVKAYVILNKEQRLIL